MGIMKRIATARITNPTLYGARTDKEILAMKRLMELEKERRLQKPAKTTTPGRS